MNRERLNRDLRRRALLLAYATVAWNVVEGVVSIGAGAAAGSTALVGFGLDSFVESLSGGVMIWRFGQHDAHAAEAVERRATRLVGWTLIVLAAYVLLDAAWSLYSGERPERSVLGMAITLLSLVVMPVLFIAKRRTARALASRSMAADSRQTLACAWLSAGVLGGLLLNRYLGWWWADGVIALAIALWLFREGREALTEGKLCAC
ncbi:MAG TPA: cation transporter [Longimicrobiaceae bacterium]|nr:cation transporter [Longimicrobiaceae bacterium]